MRAGLFMGFFILCGLIFAFSALAIFFARQTPGAEVPAQPLIVGSLAILGAIASAVALYRAGRRS